MRRSGANGLAWLVAGGALAPLGLWLASSGNAAQHPPSSLFTSIALEACKPIKQKAEAAAKSGAGKSSGKSWLCMALMPIYAAEREGHFFVAIGANARQHKAAQQTLEPVNSPLDHKSKRITVEWRIKTRAAGPQPYASIIRYFTTANGKPGEVLVVTKLGNGQSCHVAYIDAMANPDAIVMARAVADEKTPVFDCATGEPAWIGVVGKG